MGRLFDGVSALLNICTTIEYDAQAAIELEALLDRKHHIDLPFEYKLEKQNSLIQFDHTPVIRQITEHLLNKDASPEQISRRFHSTIVDMTVKICIQIREDGGPGDVVLSGGVFMNEFLLINTIKQLEKQGFIVYCQQKVPSNDGGIALGQAMIAGIKEQE